MSVLDVTKDNVRKVIDVIKNEGLSYLEVKGNSIHYTAGANELTEDNQTKLELIKNQLYAYIVSEKEHVIEAYYKEGEEQFSVAILSVTEEKKEEPKKKTTPRNNSNSRSNNKRGGRRKGKKEEE